MLGVQELLLLTALALLILFSRRLPDLGRALGGSFEIFRKALRGQEPERPIKDVEDPS